MDTSKFQPITKLSLVIDEFANMSHVQNYEQEKSKQNSKRYAQTETFY